MKIKGTKQTFLLFQKVCWVKQGFLQIDRWVRVYLCLLYHSSILTARKSRSANLEHVTESQPKEANSSSQYTAERMSLRCSCSKNKFTYTRHALRSCCCRKKSRTIWKNSDSISREKEKKKSCKSLGTTLHIARPSSPAFRAAGLAAPRCLPAGCCVLGFTRRAGAQGTLLPKLGFP